NKRLGQHFLIDLNLMRLLVDSANIQKDDVVLEVGCGTGSMTEALAEKAGKVIAIELDPNLFKITEKQLSSTENLQLINADILESKNMLSHAVVSTLSLARQECRGRFLLVANLPYDVASSLLINLVMGPTIADAMYMTVQKEVADRMTAAPASGNYGILSIFLGATGNVKMIRTLKPAVFWPRPQVNSAMVRFVRNQAKSDRIANMELFSEIVHLFMGHRRKTLLSCSKLARGKLKKDVDWPEIFEQCSINPKQRPEILSAEEYVAMAISAGNSRFLY
ncbi:MAG: ribosomal RNA small subunit methyltransferase A, partial [Sedimentisphaerales bacterium]|nr:ribosomal RNA small subunit methyltransferase A [Sedimentisphaerales bacterium]